MRRHNRRESQTFVGGDAYTGPKFAIDASCGKRGGRIYPSVCTARTESADRPSSGQVP
ncbi:MAG: hypothetical protein ACLVJO_02015 [[Clostridium] scindens]